MNHLTDETLNEYLDNELPDRMQMEQHLATCADCAARLAALQALFTELDTLPEEELSRDIASRLTFSSQNPALPRWLTLTATLQGTLAVITIILAAPFVMEFASSYMGSLQMPSLAEIVFQAQAQWTTWLDTLSTFHFPTLPQLPPLEMSSLMLMVTLAGISLLWLIGNGLLLRKQMK